MAVHADEAPTETPVASPRCAFVDSQQLARLPPMPPSRCRCRSLLVSRPMSARPFFAHAFRPAEHAISTLHLLEALHHRPPIPAPDEPVARCSSVHHRPSPSTASCSDGSVLYACSPRWSACSSFMRRRAHGAWSVAPAGACPLHQRAPLCVGRSRGLWHLAVPVPVARPPHLTIVVFFCYSRFRRWQSTPLAPSACSQSIMPPFGRRSNNSAGALCLFLCHPGLVLRSPLAAQA